MNGLLAFIEMKQKKIYLKKMADSKKPNFPAPPILNSETVQNKLSTPMPFVLINPIKSRSFQENILGIGGGRK